MYINSNHQLDDDDFYDKNLALFEVRNISATLSSGYLLLSYNAFTLMVLLYSTGLRIENDALYGYCLFDECLLTGAQNNQHVAGGCR